MKGISRKDSAGRELALGDWVKVTPPVYAQDQTGHLFSTTAEVGRSFEAPESIGTVLARVCDLLRADEYGVALPDVIRVTWLASHTGSQRGEDVLAGDCELVLLADGSEVE